MDTLSEGEIGMLNDTAKLQNRITAAAVALFRKLGYEKTTVNDICREADIARSTFYLNFAGKKRYNRQDPFGCPFGQGGFF